MTLFPGIACGIRAVAGEGWTEPHIYFCHRQKWKSIPVTGIIKSITTLGLRGWPFHENGIDPKKYIHTDWL